MNADALVLTLLHDTIAHPGLDGVMIVLTVFVPFVVFVTAVADARKGDRRSAVVALAAALVALVVSVELQFILLRVRPLITNDILGSIDGPSFPSGHATVMAAWAVLLGLRHRRAMFPAILAAVAVGVSRVYVGHHHPSDVLVGWTIGGGIGALFFGAFHSVEQRSKWSWWLWPQFSVVVFATVGAYLKLYDFSVLRLPYADKVLHFVLFGALAFFLVGFMHRWRATRVLGVLAVIATIDELVQGFSPARTLDAGDLVCTLAGVLVLGLLGAKLRCVAPAPGAEGHRPGTPASDADGPWPARAA